MSSDGIEPYFIGVAEYESRFGTQSCFCLLVEDDKRKGVYGAETPEEIGNLLAERFRSGDKRMVTFNPPSDDLTEVIYFSQEDQPKGEVKFRMMEYHDRLRYINAAIDHLSND